MKAVQVENVVKRYGMKENIVSALNGVSFEVESGEFVAIVGKSGSGKSTLLHVLGGIESFDEGTVKINEQEISKMKKEELAQFRRREIGLIYQFYNLVSVLNVEENILLTAQLDSKVIDKKRLEELMELLNISERRTHFPNQLSGGQQQRVAIARALYNDPVLILADEPTGNLDSCNGEEVIRALEELNKKYNKTIILVTHDMQIAKRADRIITLCDGLVVGTEG